MSTHPDIAARAALGNHRDRIAAAQQANLINQAQRLQPAQYPRPPLIARIIGLITLRRRRVTRLPAPTTPAIKAVRSASA